MDKKAIIESVAAALCEVGPKPYGYWSDLASRLGVSPKLIKSVKHSLLHPRPIPLFKPRRGDMVVNARILEVLRQRDSLAMAKYSSAVEVPNWIEVAEELGLTHAAVMQRASRIRRGVLVVREPQAVCECDEYGPCEIEGHREKYERALGYAG